LRYLHYILVGFNCEVVSKDGGWWYYHLYGLAVKTPHGTQFLLALAVVLMIHQWWTRKSRGNLAEVSGVFRVSSPS